jgi:hypothetical protein
MSKVRALWTALAALAAALLLTVAQTGTADAATYTMLANFKTNTCLAEDGSNAPAYVDNCDGNHSLYWTFAWKTGSGNAAELINLHSSLCLSVKGTAKPVYIGKCAENHAQWWYAGAKYTWEGGGKLGVEYSIVNAHTGLCLWWTGSSMVQATCSGADGAGDLWYWIGSPISHKA